MTNTGNAGLRLALIASVVFALAVAWAGCAGVPPRPAGGNSIAASVTPMARYSAFVLESIDWVEAGIPSLVTLAEQLAERHAAGGMFSVIWELEQGPQSEVKGRSGGLMAMDDWLGKKFAQADRSKDVAITGWQRDPEPGDLDILRKYHDRFFVVAFGPRNLSSLAPHVALCDVWIDTGLAADDRVVNLPDGSCAGRGNALVNTLNVWALQAEFVAALTRRGKMPTLLKSHMWEDSKAWNERYRFKMAFHDDLTVKSVAAGVLSRQYLEQIRGLVRTFAQTQQAAVNRTADLIAAESVRRNRTLVAQTDHTTQAFVGRHEDAVWAAPLTLYETPGSMTNYVRKTADGALVLRLGYIGLEPPVAEILRQKRQRVLLITSMQHPRPEYQPPADVLALIDTGGPFGDACVQIEGYPIRVFPPSGVMKFVAYESVNVEVMSRLAARGVPVKQGI